MNYTIMVSESHIFNQEQYHINKGFHKQVKGPLSYMIKVIGIDYESKTTCEKEGKVCKKKIMWDCNEKFLKVLSMFFLRKKVRRRIKRSELKKKKYEEVEEAI